MATEPSIFSTTPAAKRLAASPLVRRNADLTSESYKARMRNLLWSTVPETFLSKTSDGSPNPEYNRSDPRVSAQDARRIVTLSKRLTDCELSLAPPQHLPTVGEMTKRLGMLHSYALVEPAREDSTTQKRRFGRARSRSAGSPLDDEDEEAGNMSRERGMTVERRRQERWLRLQRQKLEALKKAEAESKPTKKRGVSSSAQMRPLSSQVIQSHQKLKEMEARIAELKHQKETEERQKDMLAPPSNLLSTRLCHLGYSGPQTRTHGGEESATDFERTNDEKGTGLGNSPQKPDDSTRSSHNKAHSGSKQRGQHKSPPAGVLQPPEGSVIANASGYACLYVSNSSTAEKQTRLGAGASRRSSVALSQISAPADVKNVRALLVPRPAALPSEAQRALTRQQGVEAEANAVFKIANGKSPLIFRNLRASPVLTDGELHDMLHGRNADDLRGFGEEEDDGEEGESEANRLPSTSNTCRGRVSASHTKPTCSNISELRTGAPKEEEEQAQTPLDQHFTPNASPSPTHQHSVSASHEPTYQSPNQNAYGLRYDPIFERLNRKKATAVSEAISSSGVATEERAKVEEHGTSSNRLNAFSTSLSVGNSSTSEGGLAVATSCASPRASTISRGGGGGATKRGPGVGLSIIMAAATGRNMTMTLDSPRTRHHANSEALQRSTESLAVGTPRKEEIHLGGLATMAVSLRGADEGTLHHHHGDGSDQNTIDVQSEHVKTPVASDKETMQAFDGRKLAVFPSLEDTSFLTQHEHDNHAYERNAAAPVSTGSPSSIQSDLYQRKRAVANRISSCNAVVAPMDPCYILSESAVDAGGSVDLIRDARRRERRRQKLKKQQGTRGEDIAHSAPRASSFLPPTHSDLIMNMSVGQMVPDTGGWRLSESLSCDDDSGLSADTSSSHSSSSEREEGHSKAPKRRILRAPKKSRWMKSFDTALMISEALHSVEASRSKPPVVRCSPNETSSKKGELSSRAVIPAPLRLSIPVKYAEETREKLELTHMQPVLAPDGSNALRSAFSIRSPSRGGARGPRRDEDATLYAYAVEGRPSPTKARVPSSSLSPDLTVLPRSTLPTHTCRSDNAMQENAGVSRTSSPVGRKDLLTRVRPNSRLKKGRALSLDTPTSV